MKYRSKLVSISSYGLYRHYFHRFTFTYYTILEDHLLSLNQHVIFPHCATSRKVAGSIPDGVIGIFR